MKKINPHLLSVRALLAFHIAARERNFTRAAEVLSIGQSAISHGVRQLEERLGVVLFERQHQGVQLTEVGERLAKRLERGFQEIQAGLEDVMMAQRQQHKVTLSVSTSLASHWLMPRIARFKQQHPDVQLRCITQDTDFDLNRLDFDLCIPLGQVPWQGYRRWKFAEEVIFPVCSPAFLERYGPFVTPADLQGLNLIHLEELYAARYDWRQYFRHYDLTPQSSTGDASYNDYSIVVQAAMEGQGVALGWLHIVRPLLESGKLVAPLPERIATNHDFYVVAREGQPMRVECRALLDWLLEEMSSTAVPD
ncbi:MAG: LysR family transcriptional regulator [Thiothrix sp.]|nr:LysR family transcriptional regulator [Thiothrix sp.]